MADNQYTVGKSLEFSGKGLHTGVNVNMKVLPAEAGSGIFFVRTDLPGCPEVPALVQYVTDTSRGTTVEKGPAKVCTIEHLMAALWSLGVDNARVELDGPEVPILDGSSRFYAEAVLKAGLEEQRAEREYFTVKRKTVYRNPEKGSEITAYPDDEFAMSVHVDYNSKVVGNQYASFGPGSDFAAEVSPCRTFVFLHELEPLLNHNLIKGGDLDNAIVVVDNCVSAAEIERLSSVFGKKDIKVSDGYINNLQLRFGNEIARHKLLDLAGDLALLGRRIRGRIMAVRPGHLANTEFVRVLASEIRKEAVAPRYAYDPAAEPVYDINKIRKTLPHRPPFLLVDRIFHIDEKSVAGIKNVTMNEPFFVGHFPAEPVMPGVLIIEAMAQCGGILALNGIEDPENYSTYFLRIDGVRFKQKVVPGDTIQFELSLTQPIRHGIVSMEAKAYVAGRLTTEAVLTAQVSRNKV